MGAVDAHADARPAATPKRVAVASEKGYDIQPVRAAFAAGQTPPSWAAVSSTPGTSTSKALSSNDTKV